MAVEQMMGGMAHLDDKTCIPLQTADMVASMGKEMATEYLETMQPVMLKRMKGSFYRLYIWNETAIRDL